MADVKITDIQLIEAVTDSVNIPGDEGIQTYRMTAAQFNTYIQGKNRPIIPPVVRRYLTGSGDHYRAYAFRVSGASATAAATYLNNTQTFTVLRTIASENILICSGTGAPTSTGTLTKDTGTGNATINFTEVFLPLYAKLKMVGGGGAGGGGGTNSGAGADGGAGGDTTFGSILTAGGGLGGLGGNDSDLGRGAGGGTNSTSGGTIISNLSGGSGSGGGSQQVNSGSGNGMATGGSGAPSFFGGGGGGGARGNAGFDAIENSGSGGGGGGVNPIDTQVTFGGGGGGAGGFLEAMIPSPAASYPYEVGGAGVLGDAGSSGFDGGAGAKGIIINEEHFQ